MRDIHTLWDAPFETFMIRQQLKMIGQIHLMHLKREYSTIINKGESKVLIKVNIFYLRRENYCTPEGEQALWASV